MLVSPSTLQAEPCWHLRLNFMWFRGHSCQVSCAVCVRHYSQNPAPKEEKMVLVVKSISARNKAIKSSYRPKFRHQKSGKTNPVACLFVLRFCLSPEKKEVLKRRVEGPLEHFPIFFHLRSS